MTIVRFLTLSIATVLVAIAGPSVAQTPAPDRATLNLRDFDFVVAKIEANYAGWDTKVTPANRPALTALTERLRARAATASDAELAELLKEWAGFFKDGHTQVAALTSNAAPAASPAPERALSEGQMRARLTALGKKRHPLEGIWRIGGGRYRVGILRDGAQADRFTAVVLTTEAENWRPGQIKAQITRNASGQFAMTYYRGDHSADATTATMAAGGAAISVAKWGGWERELPAVTDPDVFARQFPSDALFLKPLSPRTWWLRIPDFDGGRAKPLAALLNAHKADLERADNLVIDLRNNGGGSDFVYAPILPLLYTRPIYSIGIELRASSDNVALRRAVADQIRSDAPETAAELDEQIKRMAAATERYYRPNPKSFSVERMAKILPRPKRVAVLIDGAGSTGEQFLLDARQSHKVTLFGQRNSAGVLDFANVVGVETPSKRFRVQWATSRSLRLPGDPVDPDGITPDVRIPESEADPVRFAQAWLERQRD